MTQAGRFWRNKYFKEEFMTKENETNLQADNKQNEICPVCGKVHDIRQNLGVKATPEEVDSVHLINNRINAAIQAAQPSAVQPGVTKEQVQLFVAAALEARAEAEALQSAWWKEIFAKYPALPKDKNVYVDFDTGEFYILTPHAHS
jgi:hypothetical protein